MGVKLKRILQVISFSFGGEFVVSVLKAWFTINFIRPHLYAVFCP